MTAQLSPTGGRDVHTVRFPVATPPSEIEVLVVGAGPSGLGAAVELAAHGVQVAVVDRAREATLARAGAMGHSARTVEHFRRWGLLQAIRDEWTFPPEWNQGIRFVTSLVGHDLAPNPRPAFAAAPGAPRPRVAAEGIRRPQTVLQKVFLGHLGLHGVSVAGGWRVGALTEDADATTYYAASRIASTFRRGRVLLLGDAAHVRTPGGNLGEGFGDVANLGWKLAAVLRGHGGEALLDSYDAERRRHNWRIADNALESYRRGQAGLAQIRRGGIPDDADLSPEAEARRAEIAASLGGGFADRGGLTFDERYDASPVVWYEPGQLAGEPAWEAGRYADDPRPGHRAPNGEVDPYGSTLYDRIGNCLALLVMTFLANVAARTSRIRLATAITILPLEDPLRLAEDVSVVDTISGGRVEIGVGSGASKIEYAAFGRDVERKRELTTEGLAVLTKALAGEEVGTAGFRIQPPPGDFSDRIWQGVFSAGGAQYAAASGSNLLLNRAAYGYSEPTDEVQRPWADAYLAAWSQPRRPRIGLSRFVFPAKDRKTALDIIGADVLRAARRAGSELGFPADLHTDEALRRFHSFYGHPDEIIAALRNEKVLPVATDLITQFNPAIVDHDNAIRALELIATEIAPALGWKPVGQTESPLTGVRP